MEEIKEKQQAETLQTETLQTETPQAEKLQEETPGTEQTSVKADEEKEKVGLNTAEMKKVPAMKNTRIIGISIRLLLGLLLLVMGLWLWTKTLGTQLLFTNVTIGRVSHYWIIPVIVGVGLLISVVRSVLRMLKPKIKGKKQQTFVVAEVTDIEPQAPA